MKIPIIGLAFIGKITKIMYTVKSKNSGNSPLLSFLWFSFKNYNLDRKWKSWNLSELSLILWYPLDGAIMMVPIFHALHQLVSPSKVDKLKDIIALESLNCTLIPEIREKGIRGRTKRSHLNLGRASPE